MNLKYYPMCGKKSIRTLSLKTKEVLDKKYLPVVKEFVKVIK